MVFVLVASSAPLQSPLQDSPCTGWTMPAKTPAKTPKTSAKTPDTLTTPPDRGGIEIRNARMHNLRGIDVVLPRHQLVVVTGLSGSGKSSLIFDTLYAEGQRRYVESLSSYARQFLQRMPKPEVDDIRGLSPAMAIDQHHLSRNPRSTVGTTTEIYDYFRLLFARCGHTLDPQSGEEVRAYNTEDLLKELRQKRLETAEAGAELLVLCPLPAVEQARHDHPGLQAYLEELLQRGYTRLWSEGTLLRLESLLEPKTRSAPKIPTALHLVLDRVVWDPITAQNPAKNPAKNPSQSAPSEADFPESRLSEAIEQAWVEGDGEACLVWNGSYRSYSRRFESGGKTFEPPSLALFNFSGPYGACPRCEGFGSILGIDPDLVIPDKRRSIYDGAIAPWKGEKMSEWNEALIASAAKFRFPIHKPYQDLSDEFKDLLWKGNKHFDGLDTFFRMLEENTYKIQYRVMLSRYRGKTTCPDCKGTRLRKDAAWVHLLGQDGSTWNLHQLLTKPAGDLLQLMQDFRIQDQDAEAARRPLEEIVRRLGYLCDLGLEYLSMHRLSNSLSGGEAQRIKLATTLGSNLVGSLYVLDEPSIGLHQRDSRRLIQLLYQLRDLGNTVVVVEHEPDLIMAADHVVDIGPGAGHLGGELVFEGTVPELLQSKVSLTAAYLNGTRRMPDPPAAQKHPYRIILEGAGLHNLQRINIEIPLGTLCCVSGVSGSGKSSLIKGVLFPALANALGQDPAKAGPHDRLHGDLHRLTFVEMVDQHPIGKSSRSNPATYSKAYDPIRNLFATQGLSRQRGYKASHFSFNVEGGGRCETCQGEGQVTVSMQFLADLHLPCETCKGLRFQEDLLEVRYRGSHIAEVLAMTVAEALEFFGDRPEIAGRLQPLADVGMGYVPLGQSSTTLSGGEAQRIKLASYLVRGQKDGAGLFIFDEPTTGLHLHDIAQLLGAFRALIANGHSVLVIEHNPEVLMASDWILDLGPEGGSGGGQLVFAGTPQDLLHHGQGHTADALRSRPNQGA